MIEHHIDIIKSADWVVDIGPTEVKGGNIVATGTPEQIAEENSYTGYFLKEKLKVNTKIN